MACGCPVVVSNAASLPEVCGDAALYIEPTDILGITQGIYQCLTDGGLRGSLKKKVLEKAKFFSWEKTATKHLEVFERLWGI
jgi:glycosyltransferase involved in cell wall biosynthesis